MIITVLVEKAICSLFGRKKLPTDIEEWSRFSQWRGPVFEKLLRVLHFVSFFLAGLSRPQQRVLWFTDEDDIAANEQRMQELLDFFGEICEQHLPHPLETIHVGTTQFDDGTMDIEDFVAIADLVAGAVSCALTASRDSGALPSSELQVPLPGDLPEKAGIILDWLADLSQPFKRLVLLIEPTCASPKSHRRLSGGFPPLVAMVEGTSADSGGYGMRSEVQRPLGDLVGCSSYGIRAPPRAKHRTAGCGSRECDRCEIAANRQRYSR